jgi:hypothetical protein
MVILVSACSKNNDQTPAQNNDYEYFIIDSTKSYYYLVDSISYNDNTKTIDTFQYTLKTQFSESFTATNGNKIWRLQRFAKYKNNTDFEEIQNHFVRIENNKYILTQNNVDLVKAVFPLKKNLSWNGNLFNSNNKITSSVYQINETLAISDTTFTNALHINEENSLDFIFEINRESIYQKNTGLVYFKDKLIETQTDQNGAEIKSGYDISQKLLYIQ